MMSKQYVKNVLMIGPKKVYYKVKTRFFINKMTEI